MRTLLTTTALVALFSMGAVAQDATAPAATDPAAGNSLLTQGYDVIDTDALASRLIGFPVYSSAAADAENLGDINDIVIGDDGSVAAVIIGVGGFLGIGEKKVAVDYERLEWTIAEDDTERLVLEVTREQLETAQAVELVEDDPMLDTAATDPMAPDADQPMDAAPADDAMDTAAADPAAEPMDAAEPADEAMDTAAADPADEEAADAMDPAGEATDVAQADPAEDPAVDENMETGAIGSDQDMAADDPMLDPLNREGLVEFDESSLTAEDLIGINVYGPNDEHIGSIGDFVLGTDDSVDALIIDFGGFLGIGTKQVAVGYSELDFFADENGDNRYLVLNITREMMEQAPEFNKDTYAQERDAQRLVLDGDVAAN